MTGFVKMVPSGAIDGVVRPPGSKSITNRALICSVLAKGPSLLRGALKSDDTEVMVNSLNALGFQVEPDWERSLLKVQGQAGVIPANQAVMDLKNSGTSIRFLTALCSLGQGRFTLDGVDRMRQRPIGDLVAALNQLGGSVKCIDGCPPVEIEARGLIGGSAKVAGGMSSQFLSALLMILPQMQKFTVLQVAGALVSQPYVSMTCQVMSQFGVDVTQMSGEYSIDPRHAYTGQDYEIEPDASAASYFWAAAAITGGRCHVEGLKLGAVQGDTRFLQLLEEMGCEIISNETGTAIYGGPLKGIEADMNDISDTVQTLAAVALFAEGPTTIKGVAHNRFKETDRIGNLAIELRKLGAAVEEREDGMVITPRPLRGAEIETYDDHRMAMALSLVGLRQENVVIRDPECVSKTYPGFWEDLKAVAES